MLGGEVTVLWLSAVRAALVNTALLITWAKPVNYLCWTQLFVYLGAELENMGR